MSINIPPRLRQAYCQQFVIAFEFAARVWPKPFRVMGFTHAPSTLAARLRDCLLSMKRYKWGPEFPEFVIKQTDEGVVISGPSTANAPTTQEFSTSDQLLKLTTTQLEAFCILLSDSLIIGPVTVLNNFDPTYLANLEAQHNIAITHNPTTTSFTLL